MLEENAQNDGNFANFRERRDASNKYVYVIKWKTRHRKYFCLR